MSATGLDRWGDAIPPAPVVPPVIYKPRVQSCVVCGKDLSVTIVGGNPIRICPVHGTRGVQK